MDSFDSIDERLADAVNVIDVLISSNYSQLHEVSLKGSMKVIKDCILSAQCDLRKEINNEE